MLTPVRSAQFRRDVKRLGKRGKDMTKLRKLISLLINEQDLHPSGKDHALKGTWSGCRDVHVEADWVLIYAISGSELRLFRTGTHADVFEE